MNFVGIATDSKYMFYDGRAFSGREQYRERKTEMEEELRTNYNLLKQIGVDDNPTLSEKVLVNLETAINESLQREKKFYGKKRNVIKSFTPNDINGFITQSKEIEEQLSSILLQGKNIGDQGYAELLAEIGSEDFLNRITVRSATLSYQLAGGAKTVKGKKAQTKIREVGKNKVQTALTKSLLTKKRDSNVLEIKKNPSLHGVLDLLLQGYNRKMTTEIKKFLLNEEETTKILGQSLDSILLNLLSNNDLIVDRQKKTGPRATFNEGLSKSLFKKMAFQIKQVATEYQKETTGDIQQVFNNLAEGNFIKNANNNFSLKLNQMGEKGIYTQEMEVVFYEKNIQGDLVKKENLDNRTIAEAFYNLLINNLRSVAGKDWLIKNKAKFIKSLSTSLNTKHQQYYAFNKSVISGIMGSINAILTFSMGTRKKVSETGFELNELGQQIGADLKVGSGASTVGIQIKNLSSVKGDLISLYSDTSFSLDSGTASKYIDREILDIIKFLLANEKLMSEKFGMNLDRTQIEKLLLNFLPQFLRVSRLDADLELPNSFYLLNGKIITASHVLAIAYQNAKGVLQQAKNKTINQIVQIQGSKIDYITIEDDAEISKYAWMKDGQQKCAPNAPIAITVDGTTYPQDITKKNLLSNIRVNFKGIKIKI